MTKSDGVSLGLLDGILKFLLCVLATPLKSQVLHFEALTVKKAGARIRSSKGSYEVRSDPVNIFID